MWPSAVLDDHFAKAWQEHGDYHDRARRRRHGLPNYRIIRYADDFVVMVFRNRDRRPSAQSRVAEVLAPMGLRLQREDDDLPNRSGLRLSRLSHPATPRSRPNKKRYVYTYPAKKALASIVDKVRALTPATASNPSRKSYLHRLNRCYEADQLLSDTGVLQDLQLLRAFSGAGWFAGYEASIPRLNWKQLRRATYPGGWPTAGEVNPVQPVSCLDRSIPATGETHFLTVAQPDRKGTAA